MHSYGVHRRDGEHTLFREGVKKYYSIASPPFMALNKDGLFDVIKDKVQFHHLLGPKFFALFLFAGIDVFAVNLVNK
jgi:hypothetical protein